METAIGTCRYCGKAEILALSAAIDEEEADELVTGRCKCPEGATERAKAALDEKIDDIVGTGAKASGYAECDEGVGELVKQVALMLFDEALAKATLTLPCGDVVKLEAKSNAVEIKRINKNERTKQIFRSET